MSIAIILTDEQLDVIAQRAAALIAERETASASPWLNAEQAAQHLACSVGRIHDLVQIGKLTPHRDGRRLLFRPEDLDAYLGETA